VDKCPKEHPVSQGTRRSLQSPLPPPESTGSTRISWEGRYLTRPSLQSPPVLSYGSDLVEALGFSARTQDGKYDTPSSTPGAFVAIAFVHHTD
jgi:hypothetical protein